MTSAIVNLTDENNRVLNIIKAHFDLKSKSDAINFILEKYAKDEPEVRPEYIKKLQRIMKTRGKTYASADEMFRGFEKDV